MNFPLLVIVQGAPGSGKTTLINRLKREFSFPAIGKDDIKEFLFDNLKQSDREFSMVQGRVSFAMLYAFAASFLESKQSVIIEGAFHVEFAREELRNIIANTNARCIELYCHVDEDVRVDRFEKRVLDGTRHLAHLDSSITPHAGLEKYAPLSIGRLIDVDTTELSVERYEAIISEVRHVIEERG
jgi:predicted kinase